MRTRFARLIALFLAAAPLCAASSTSSIGFGEHSSSFILFGTFALLLCGFYLFFGVKKHNEARVQCPKCSTHVFPDSENCCCYCGSTLDKRKAASERTPVGLPNFFSLRDEINARVFRRKIYFFLGTLGTALVIALTFKYAPRIPETIGVVRPIPILILLSLAPLFYINSRVWAAATCPKCKGTLARWMGIHSRHPYDRTAEGFKKFPSQLKVHVRECPHCKTDFDHSPGHYLRLREARSRERKAA